MGAMGDLLAVKLRALAQKHPSIGEVRGLGLFWGVELVRVRVTREPLVPFNAAGEDFGECRLLEALCRHRGLPAGELLGAIVGEVQRFAAGEQHDDITLLVARCRC